MERFTVDVVLSQLVNDKSSVGLSWYDVRTEPKVTDVEQMSLWFEELGASNEKIFININWLLLFQS